MTGRLPPLESLRFLEVSARHGNFTHAAVELGVTPAAVSLRIRDLEAELGTKLFHRSGPRISLTSSGAVLSRRMSELLDSIRSAVDDCRDQVEPLRVTAVPTFAMRWLTPRLTTYHALPESVPISLDVSAELRPASCFDVAVRTGSGDWPGLAATPLMSVEATPMMSPALVANTKLSSPRDLAKLTLLPHDDWPRWFREVGVDASELRFYADNYPTHELDASTAIEGTGAALLSPILFESLIRSGQLVQPFAHVLRGPGLHYVLLDPEERRPTVLRFSQWLRDEARSLVEPSRPGETPR